MHISILSAPTIAPGLATLPPAHPFAEASARVDAALDELRIAEAALERQLSDLRGYITRSGLPPASDASPAVH